MQIKVTQNEVKINKDILNDGEYNIHKCQFEFDEEYNGLVKRAVFIWENEEPIKMNIADDECNIPIEVLKEGILKIGVYAYEVNNDELILRYSPSADIIRIYDGSYVENAQNSEPVTPTDKEQMEQEIQNLVNDWNEKVESDYFKGDKGDKGDTGEQGIQGEKGDKGEKGEKGDTGDTGATGPQGPEGPRGPQGEQGPEGPQGPQGEKGDTPDLTDYVKNTDYASNNKGGVIRTANQLAVNEGGVVLCNTLTYANYVSTNDWKFISKGTLENVLNARIGDINTALDTINGESI